MMKKSKFVVYDTTDSPVGIPFQTRKEALEYKTIFGRQDWTIKEVRVNNTKKTTARQRAAVEFVEEWCQITFLGDLDDFYEVSDFLGEYLAIAKDIAEDAAAAYYSFINE